MLIDFKLLLFELNCQLFFSPFLLCSSLGAGSLFDGREVGGVPRLWESLSRGIAEEMSVLCFKNAWDALQGLTPVSLSLSGLFGAGGTRGGGGSGGS